MIRWEAVWHEILRIFHGIVVTIVPILLVLSVKNMRNDIYTVFLVCKKAESVM